MREGERPPGAPSVWRLELGLARERVMTADAEGPMTNKSRDRDPKDGPFKGFRLYDNTYEEVKPPRGRVVKGRGAAAQEESAQGLERGSQGRDP